MANWFSVDTPEAAERLLDAWADAPIEQVEVCGFLAGVARDQVIAFAPPFPGTEAYAGGEYTKAESSAAWLTAPADRLVYAQLIQLQNLWNAGRAQQDGGAGADSYSFVPRPLDKTVRAIIRPTSGVANVF